MQLAIQQRLVEPVHLFDIATIRKTKLIELVRLIPAGIETKALGGMLGNGTKIGFSASSPVTWTKVGQLLDITVPGLVPDKVETTVHSTNKFKRNMPGMIEVTDTELLCLADLDQTTSASHETIRTYQRSQTTLWWRIEVPTDRSQSAFRASEFQAWIQEFVTTAPIDGRQELRIKLVFDADDFSVYPKGASALG